jgi:hypothetical protein|tara:strand:- start:57 stop:218 length:162 start_codon:yes stop_codon:yes gene_type:complete
VKIDTLKPKKKRILLYDQMNLMSKQYGESNSVIEELYAEINNKRIKNIEKKIR